MKVRLNSQVMDEVADFSANDSSSSAGSVAREEQLAEAHGHKDPHAKRDKLYRSQPVGQPPSAEQKGAPLQKRPHRDRVTHSRSRSRHRAHRYPPPSETRGGRSQRWYDDKKWQAQEPATGRAPPQIPMLHGIFTGTVRWVTQRGAMMQLSDGGPTRYLDGLMRRRQDDKECQLGEKVYVKVVRIEPSLVTVDARTIDPETGEDSDPMNEQAEVEDWVDVPEPFVARVIGAQGARIKKICEDTGADLRFDTVQSSNVESGPGSAPGGQGAGGWGRWHRSTSIPGGGQG